MIRVCAFDVYGTLFDLAGIRAAVAAVVDDEPATFVDQFVTRWRAKQLEYSWTATLIGPRVSFEALAERALEWTLASLGGREDVRRLRAAATDAYRRLEPYPDAENCLAAVRALGLPCVVLTNGSHAPVRQLLSAAGLKLYFEAAFSAQDVGVFKPHPRVYLRAADRLGVDPSDIAFQSANAWDAAGAAAAGLKVHWINRNGSPDEYGLRGSVVELSSLGELAASLGT